MVTLTLASRCVPISSHVTPSVQARLGKSEVTVRLSSVRRMINEPRSRGPGAVCARANVSCLR
jgi:hypothetical protein